VYEGSPALVNLVGKTIGMLVAGLAPDPLKDVVQLVHW